MAKSKNSSRGTRDASQSLTVTLRSRPSSRHLDLTQVEDFRSFSFEPATRPARLFSTSPASVGLDPAQKKRQARKGRVPWQLAFQAPRETVVCVRRWRRREVLHALKKTGKRGQRKPRRSKWRSYKC